MRVRPSFVLPLAALLALCVYRAEVQLDNASAQASAAPGTHRAGVRRAPAPPTDLAPRRRADRTS